MGNKSLKDKKKAFTLAELLLSLTVIGILASIVLPSIVGNANDRAFEVQKQAIYTRFSQAIPTLPKLNGYGVGADTNNKAAIDFVRKGVASIIKTRNICDSNHIANCNFPSTFTAMDGTSITIGGEGMSTLNNFNSKISSATVPAAFETVNGESVLVYYNPSCRKVSVPTEDNKAHSPAPSMCANFIFDLNGKKGPNMVGKDIGFMTAINPRNPIVVMPLPHVSYSTSGVEHEEAFNYCSQISENLTVPNLNEIDSILYNIKLLNNTDLSLLGFWASDIDTETMNPWAFRYNQFENYLRTDPVRVWCTKRVFN